MTLSSGVDPSGRDRLLIRFERAADVGFHGVADHDRALNGIEGKAGELAAGPMEHIAVGFSEKVGAAAGAGFEEGREAAGPGLVR